MKDKKSTKTPTPEPSEVKKKTKAPEWLFANIAEVSKSARKIYFLYIGFLFYCAFTVIGVEDRYIILNEKVHLPIINVDIPIFGFLFMAPLVAIFVFFYLQLYLGRLKWLINLNTNYAPIEKGRLYPWMLNFPKDPESGFTMWLQNTIIKFSLWGLLPLVLGQFALLAARTHNPLHSYAVGAMPIFGASIVLLFWFRYEGVQRKFIKFILKNWGKIILVFIMLLWELGHFQNTIPDSMKGNYNRLDLSHENLITEPKQDYPGIHWGDFWGVHLEGAVLISTTLKRADLRNAHLQYSYMNKVNLEEANLSYANLNGADLSGANLIKAVLNETELNGAIFIDADLEEANLRNADLSGANFRLAKNLTVNMLKEARNWFLAFYDEDVLTLLGLPLDHYDRVSQRNFSEYNFYKSNLSGADLSKSNLTKTDLSDADLSDATFSAALLLEAILRGATLTSSDLSDADLSFADLSDADLSNAILIGAELFKADLSYANLSYANLSGAKNLTVAQLSKVKTLYGTKMDEELMDQIKKQNPHLLEKPKEEE